MRLLKLFEILYDIAAAREKSLVVLSRTVVLNLHNPGDPCS